MGPAKWLLIAVVLIGLVLEAPRRAAAQEAAPAHALKVAVLCTDDSGRTADNVAALLEAGLSGSRAFGLVERQALQRVLKEQTLQPLSDASGAIKIGQLVGADLLLFCQSVPGSKPPLMRLRIVETGSGVILLDQLEELQSLTDASGDFRPVVEAAVKKAAIPVPDRKLIGLVDVSSEEPGKALDPLMTTLDVLLRTDLARSPSVVVLEREQLRHLVAERGLSGTDVKLRASTRLLEVRAKRGQDEHAKDKLDFAVKITDMSGGKAQTVTVLASQDDLAALRAGLAAAILKALDAPLPRGAAGDVKAEAKAFDERATFLLMHGYLQESLRLAETAYALDPQRAYFDTLARACLDIFNGLAPAVGSDQWIYSHPGMIVHLSGATRVKGVAWVNPHVATLEQLNAALLLAQIHLDASRRLAATIPADMRDPEALHWGPTFIDLDAVRPMFPLPETPGTPEQKILQQLVDVTGQEYRLWLDVYRAHHWPLAGLDYMAVILSPFLVPDGAAYCKAAQAAYEDFKREQAAWLKEKAGNRPIYPDISVTFIDLLYSGQVGNVKLDDVRPLLDWLTRQSDPLLCVQGWNAYARSPDAQGHEAAVRAANAIFRAIPIGADVSLPVFYAANQGELFRQKPIDEIAPQAALPLNYVSYALARLHEDNALRDYTSGLLDELEKRGDALPLVRWPEATYQLLSMPARDELPLALRVQKLLESKPVPAEYAKNLQLILDNLKDRIQLCRQRLKLAGDEGNLWNALTVRPIKYDRKPAGVSTLIWVSVERTVKEPDLLMLWRSDPIDEHAGLADFTLVVGRLSLAGGPITELARGRFSSPAAFAPDSDLRGFRITSVLPTPAGIFIADFGRGLLVARDGKFATWTAKDGLPSDQIWSLAWTGRTLYAGADDGFMALDPQTRQCKTLGSAKSAPSLNPLDGGTPYRVANILPSPDGKSLWLAIGADQTRLGVWRYDLASGTYEHIVHISDKDPTSPDKENSGPSLTWHDGNLLVIGRSAGRGGRTGLYDADSGIGLKTFYGQRMYDVSIADRLPEQRGTDKEWRFIDYTPQHRAALTAIGFITYNGEAVDPATEASFYNWNVDPIMDRLSLRRSRLATPELCRDWNMIEEVGSDFVTATYGDEIDRPTLWYFMARTTATTSPATAPGAP